MGYTLEKRAINGLREYSGNVSYIYQLLYELRNLLETDPDSDKYSIICFKLATMYNKDASGFFKNMSNLTLDKILKEK